MLGNPLMKIVEEWDKNNPKTGLAASQDPINLKKVNQTRCAYGNYAFRNALMEVLTLIDDKNVLVSIDGYNAQYFQVLQKNLRSTIKNMVKML